MSIEIAALGVELDTTKVVSGKQAMQDATASANRLADSTDKIAAKGSANFKSLSDGTDMLRKKMEQLALAVGTVVGFHAMLKATEEAQDAFAKLSATLTATGNVLGITANQLAEYALQLQSTTKFSDEAVMGAEALLVTFTKLGKDVFPRAIASSADLASLMGTDITSAAFVLGKALNDPAEGLAALSRQGIRFNDITVATIKKLDEVGRTAEAQGIILAEVEKRTKGVAEAMRGTLSGAIAGLKNQFGELFENRSSGLDDLTRSINDLTTLLKDPDIAAGITNITTAMIKLVDWSAKAAVWLDKFGVSVGEAAAKFREGSDNNNAKFDELTQRLAQMTAMRDRFFITDPAKLAMITDIERQIAALRSVADANLADGNFIGNLLGEVSKVKPVAGDALGGMNLLTSGVKVQTKSVKELADELHVQTEAQKKAAEEAKKHADVINTLLDRLLPLQGRQRKYAEDLKLLNEAYPIAKRGAGEYQAALQALKDELNNTADAEKDLSSAQAAEAQVMAQNQQDIRELTKSLEAEYAALAAGTDAEYERVRALLEAKDATKEQIEEVLSLTQAVKAMRELSEHGLTGKTISFEDAVGLGGVFTALDKLGKAFDGIGSKGKTAFKEISTATKLFSAAAKADGQEAFGMYIEGTAAALSGVQQFAKEGTQAYAAIGIAVEALHTVTAVQAALNAFATAPWPVNFASLAAAIAAIASLGISIGGFSSASGGAAGAGSAPSGSAVGAGTVLGDLGKQSESIKSALDSLTKIAEHGLDYSAAQLQALRSIDASLRDVGTSLVRNFAATGTAMPAGFKPQVGNGNSILSSGFSGGLPGLTSDLTSKIPLIGDIASIGIDLGGNIIEGLLGGTFKEIQDTGLWFDAGQTLGQIAQQGIIGGYYAMIRSGRDVLWGMDTNVQVNREAQGFGQTEQGAQFAHDVETIVLGLQTAVLSSLDAIGLGGEQAAAVLANMALGLADISLSGLSSDQIIERLNAVFSTLGDTMASTVMPAIAEFQQVGEGAFETLVRISSQTSAVTGALSDLGTSLGTLVGLDLVRAGQDLIDAAGGFDSLMSSLGNFYGAFFTDAEKVVRGTQSMNDVLGHLGLGVLPATRDEFRDLVLGLDLTTQAGRDAFVTLTGLSGLADSVYSGMEAAANSAADAAQAATQAEQELAKQREDFALSAARLAATISGVAQGFDEAAALVRLSNAQTFQDRAAAGNDLLGIIQNQYSSESSLIDKNKNERIKAIHDLAGAEIKRLQDNSQKQQQISQAQTGAANAALQAFQKLHDAAKQLLDFADQLKMSSSGPGTPIAHLNEALKQYRDLAKVANHGNADAIGQLTGRGSELVQSARDIYGSGQAYQDIFKEVLGTSESIGGKFAAAKMPEDVQQLIVISKQASKSNDLLQRQIDEISKKSDEQIAAIEREAGAELEKLRAETLQRIDAVTNAVLHGVTVQQDLLGELTGGNAQQAALLREQIAAILALSKSVTLSATIAKQQMINVKVVTPDNRTIVDQTIKVLKDKSLRKESVIYAAGIAK